MEKEKKPVHKRWWFWVIGIVIIISWFTNSTDNKGDTEQEVSSEQKEEQVEDIEVTEEKEEPEEQTEESNNRFEYTELYEGEQTIEINPGTVWSENSFFNVVYDSLDEIKRTLDENEEVNSVLVMINTELIDNKGNEEERAVITFRYSRETFNELNYENFKKISLGEEWRILNESDGYFIHQAIRSKLKSKYTDNLR